MRICPDLFAPSDIDYEIAPTRPGDVDGPESFSWSAEGPFREPLSAMFTAAFSQTATSPLAFSAPTRPLPALAEESVLAAGLETGVALLHDHVGYVRLNPIVTDCHAVAADSDEGRKLNVPKLLADFAEMDQPAVSGPSPPTDPEQPANGGGGGGGGGWTHYTVTDALPHPFGLPGSTLLKYTIALRNLPDGIETLVASPGGVTIHGDIRVVSACEGRDTERGWRDRRGEKKLWLQERTDVRCWAGTAWYIRKTLGESHEAAHERVREQWETEVRRRVGGSAAAAAAAAAAARS
jgi:hypothetical protein